MSREQRVAVVSRRHRSHADREETAAQYGLAALLQEKPFNNINGSGKHNNWSIGTHDGINLLNIGQITKAAGDDAFPTIMAAIVSAIDKHGDLMRMAIASPGNDFRLGACEAPPAIVSTYLGETCLTSYLDPGVDVRRVEAAPQSTQGGAAYEPKTKERGSRPAASRRGRHCAVQRPGRGPQPHVALPVRRPPLRVPRGRLVAERLDVNTVLNTITAESFKEVADRIEGGETAQAVAADLINTHVPKVVFNGDNYDGSEPGGADKRGVWRIDSGVDAICRYSDPKNTAPSSRPWAYSSPTSARRCEAGTVAALTPRCESKGVRSSFGRIETHNECLRAPFQFLLSTGARRARRSSLTTTSAPSTSRPSP